MPTRIGPSPDEVSRAPASGVAACAAVTTPTMVNAAAAAAPQIALPLLASIAAILSEADSDGADLRSCVSIAI